MVACPECGDMFRMPEEALGGAEPVRMVLEMIPALGLLELIEDQSGRLGGEALREHACALVEVHEVCGRTGGNEEKGGSCQPCHSSDGPLRERSLRLLAQLEMGDAPARE